MAKDQTVECLLFFAKWRDEFNITLCGWCCLQDRNGDGDDSDVTGELNRVVRVGRVNSNGFAGPVHLFHDMVEVELHSEVVALFPHVVDQRTVSLADVEGSI